MSNSFDEVYLLLCTKGIPKRAQHGKGRLPMYWGQKRSWSTVANWELESFSSGNIRAGLILLIEKRNWSISNLSLNKENVSSTCRQYYCGLCELLSNFSSLKQTNIFYSAGPKGDSMSTPSLFRYIQSIHQMTTWTCHKRNNSGWVL